MPGRLAERVPLRRHALFSGILCHMPCEKLAGLQPHGLLLPRSPVPRPSAWSLGCSRGKARRMPAPQGRFASSRSCRQASRRCQGSLAVSVEADLAAFPARVPQEEAAKPIPQTDAWRLHRAGRQQAWRAGAACMFRRSASFLRHMSVRLAEALRAWPRAVRAGLLQGGAAGSNPAGSPGLAGRARSQPSAGAPSSCLDAGLAGASASPSFALPARPVRALTGPACLHGTGLGAEVMGCCGHAGGTVCPLGRSPAGLAPGAPGGCA